MEVAVYPLGQGNLINSSEEVFLLIKTMSCTFLLKKVSRNSAYEKNINF